MSQKTGQFSISFAGVGRDPKQVAKDRILIGRLDTCEISLDHPSVSRIHAGVNFVDSKYVLLNLSSSNVLTLNGRRLGPQKDDVLADGDTIQIGPYTIIVKRQGAGISLHVQGMVADKVTAKPVSAAAPAPVKAQGAGDVLKVFWEKRTREKEDWGTRLRPTEKPKPGKAMFNWRPTRDLRRQWRYGLFVWAFLIIGAVGAFAYFRYPNVYSPKPLANPHAMPIENTTIATAANANSCTTCHTPNEPMENSCIKCHSAQEFHATNTKAHEQAGITCTVCHKEHQGPDFQMTATAIQSCAECHNDANSKTYNGKSVRTAHGGSYGYPTVDGSWKWKGVYREVADAIPEINSSATGDKDEQAKLNRYFHTIHVYRLEAPEGMKGDRRGLVTCSTCHKSFDPIDRETPRETCAACHTNSGDTAARDARFAAGQANCISCHVQHPYSAGRWSEFLTTDALERRKVAVTNKITEFTGQ
jgi:hypothetical protein